MEKFTKRIKGKVDKLDHSYTKKEQKGIEHLIAGFEEDELEITDNIRKVTYLLDLIEKHEVKALDNPQNEETEQHKAWLSETQNSFEKIHLTKTEELSPADIELLETEKNKLEAVKKRLERDQKYILSLIAKSNVYLMEARETACKEATKGQGIAELSEKLVDHFGKKFYEESVYEVGRKKIVKFIEETFSVNKIDAQKAFDILEKSRVVKFEYDLSSLEIYMNYDDYMGVDYAPVYGTWLIDA